MNQEWLDYKREVDDARAHIRKANADLELLKSKCKCTETRPRQTLSYAGKYMSYKPCSMNVLYVFGYTT